MFGNQALSFLKIRMDISKNILARRLGRSTNNSTNQSSSTVKPITAAVTKMTIIAVTILSISSDLGTGLNAYADSDI